MPSFLWPVYHNCWPYTLETKVPLILFSILEHSNKCMFQKSFSSTVTATGYFSSAITQTDSATVTMCHFFSPLSSSLPSLCLSVHIFLTVELFPCWVSQDDVARVTCAAYSFNCSSSQTELVPSSHTLLPSLSVTLSSHTLSLLLFQIKLIVLHQ